MQEDRWPEEGRRECQLARETLWWKREFVVVYVLQYGLLASMATPDTRLEVN